MKYLIIEHAHIAGSIWMAVKSSIVSEKHILKKAFEVSADVRMIMDGLAKTTNILPK